MCSDQRTARTEAGSASAAPGFRGGLWALGLGVWFCYLVTTQGQITSSDANIRLLAAEALFLRGAVEVEGVADARHSHWDIGHTLLLAPAVVGAQIIGQAAGGDPHLYAETLCCVETTAMAAATVVALTVIAADLGLSGLGLWLFGLLAAFGSLLWPYSVDAHYEAPQALCLALAFVAIPRVIGRRSIAWSVVGGTALGLLVAINTANTILLLPLAASALCLARANGARLRRFAGPLAATLLAGAPWIAATLWYSAARWGGSFSVAPLYRIPLGTWLADPWWEGLYGLTLGSHSGLIWFWPAIVGAVMYGARLHRRAPWLSIGIWSITATIYVSRSVLYLWQAGWCWGPRFLVPGAVLLALPLAEWLRARTSESRTRKWRITCGLVIASAVVSLLGVGVNYQRWHFEGLTVEQAEGAAGAEGRLPLLRRFRLASQVAFTGRAIADMASGRVSDLHFGPREYESSTDIARRMGRLHIIDFWWIHALYLGYPKAPVLAAALLLALSGIGLLWRAKRLLTGTPRNLTAAGGVEV